MYAALLKEKLVLAIEEAKISSKKEIKNKNYVCPQCRQLVRLIVSDQKAAFFKHIKVQVNTGERDEHYFSKKTLQSALIASGFPAKTEISLANGAIRADILASDTLAFEIQCAPLSKKEFTLRHNAYHRIGIMDIWVVGRRHYLHHKLKSTQLIFLRCNKHWGHYMLEIDIAKSLLILKYGIRQNPINSQIIYSVKCFNIDDYGLTELWKFKPNISNIKDLSIIGQKMYLKRQIRQKTHLGLKVAEYLYYLEINIDDIPQNILLTWRDPGSPNVLLAYLGKKKASKDA